MNLRNKIMPATPSFPARTRLLHRTEAVRRHYEKAEVRMKEALRRARTVEAVHGTTSPEAHAAWREVEAALVSLETLPLLE